MQGKCLRFFKRNLVLPTYTKGQLHLVTFYSKEDQKWINGTRRMWFIVPCSEKPDQYIGQTKRKMITRVREHEKSCEGDLSGIQPDINNDNGIHFHYATTGHHFLFQDTRILAREKNGFKRKLIEGIHIYNKKDTCVNIIAGHKIDNSWNPIMKDLSL